jgi:putative SOS response-associated peptidase YedK
MCGRFVSAKPPEEIARYFDAVLSGELASAPTPPEPNYNVAPTTGVLAVVERQDERRLETFRWGLVPGWAKDPSVGNKMINARAETVPEKPAFKRPFASRRCIIPADGFYEWMKVAGSKRKQPVFIHRVDGEPLAFAGLWERWHDKTDPDRVLQSCTILTTSANHTIEPVHNRMPVLLPPDRWAAWLDPENRDIDALRTFLVSAPDELLTFHNVGTDVNNVRNRGAHLVELAEPISADE